MKRYKKKYNIYSAWNYEQEVLDLNAQSEKGWQLVKGKSFSHKYEYNPGYATAISWITCRVFPAPRKCSVYWTLIGNRAGSL